MLLTLPGRQLIIFVSIVHPLAPGSVRARVSHTTLSSARHIERTKRRHYADLVALRRFQLYPFEVETAAGMETAAERLVELMAEEGEAHLRV